MIARRPHPLLFRSEVVEEAASKFIDCNEFGFHGVEQNSASFVGETVACGGHSLERLCVRWDVLFGGVIDAIRRSRVARRFARPDRNAGHSQDAEYACFVALISLRYASSFDQIFCDLSNLVVRRMAFAEDRKPGSLGVGQCRRFWTSAFFHMLRGDQ